MKYKAFRIRNFKGIKDTTVDLHGIGGPSIFALVGLNESGKTTLLEAIHSFSPDTATSELLSGEANTGVPYSKRVPRHQISSFTGDISVIATLSVSERDKANIASDLERHGLSIDFEHFPEEVVLERKQRFENGDYQTNFFSLLTPIKVRSGRQRKWRWPTVEERKIVRNIIYNYTPDIAYFPTFVFDFPDRIYLTDRGDNIDLFYRHVFQDILDYDGQGYTIEKDIVRRIRGEDKVLPWLEFFSHWLNHDDRAKIQHVMDRAGAAATRLIFGQWNQIFGENTGGKEIVISFDVVEGEKKDPNGKLVPSNEHDLYIRFQIRDGTRRFNVNDRSLGFRWFFAFMLFTQFRVARSETRPVLFLFDEPASNLHAAAQQKLIDCFPRIAQGEHALIYTTHSHYMIEPKWLEQTFIVTNRADAPPSSMLEEVSLDDESLDIKVTPYRSFVNDHPSKTSYFQPILDRLEVVPSRFDIQRASIIVEGKSDYYILRYAAEALGKAELPLLPAFGAGTLGALAALHVGWGLELIFLLDGDKQGRVEKERYLEDYGISPHRVMRIDELKDGLKEIEDLFDDDARKAIKDSLGLAKLPTKNQIRRFCQERLASGRIETLSAGFVAKASGLLAAMEEKIR